MISVGAHNVYGLPSPLLLGELMRLGLPVRRTRPGARGARLHWARTLRSACVPGFAPRSGM